jgi:hypothetical protein
MAPQPAKYQRQMLLQSYLRRHIIARSVDISLKKPRAMSVSKKRKGNDATATMVSGRIGTGTEHFLAHISNVMDVQDRLDMKGHYLVMDNALTACIFQSVPPI